MGKSKIVNRNKLKTITSTSRSTLQNKSSVSPKGKIYNYIITRSRKPAHIRRNQKDVDSFVTKLNYNTQLNSSRDKLSVNELTKVTNEGKVESVTSKKTVNNKAPKDTLVKSKTITVNSKFKKARNETPVKSLKRKSKANNAVNSLYLSPSFKLDKQVPKVEDILRSIEESKNFEKVKEKIDKSAEKFLNDLKAKEENNRKLNKKKQKLLDCKNISLRDLERRFNCNLEYVDNIFHGKVYNERHEKFKRETAVNNNLTEDDLRVNETVSLFTEDQLIYIVSLFRARYDNGNIYKYSDYYFKVLLPEFCLKIFLDYYYLFKNRENAMQYLKSLPVLNNLGL